MPKLYWFPGLVTALVTAACGTESANDPADASSSDPEVVQVLGMAMLEVPLDQIPCPDELANVPTEDPPYCERTEFSCGDSNGYSEVVAFTGEWRTCVYDATGRLIWGLATSDHHPGVVGGELDDVSCVETPNCEGETWGTAGAPAG